MDVLFGFLFLIGSWILGFIVGYKYGYDYGFNRNPFRKE